MSLYQELNDQPLEVLIGYWFGEPLDGPEYADTFYDAVAYEISLRGKEGAAFLVDQLLAAGQERVHNLISGLFGADLPRRTAKKLIRPFLRSSEPRERMEAISAFTYFRDKSVREQIEPELSGDDVYVRVRALMYMGKVFPLESLDLLVRSLDDPAWEIRSTAIDELDELEDEELAASFMDRVWPFMDDPHHYVRDAANWYLMTRTWRDADLRDIRAQIRQESDPRRIASLIRFAGNQREVDIVLDYVDDPRSTVRVAALDTLREPWGSVQAALDRDPQFLDRCKSDIDQRVRDLIPELQEQLDFESNTDSDL